MSIPDYIVLDLETTGLDEETDQIIEVGMVSYHEGKETGHFECFIRPEKEIPVEIFHITGIKKSDICGASCWEEKKDKIREWIGNTTIIGHNIEFDKNILTRQGVYCKNNPSIDTFWLANICIHERQSFNLGALCEYFGILLEGEHRALEDARATGELFLRLRDEFQKLSPTQKKIFTHIFQKGNAYLFPFLFSEQERTITEKNFIDPSKDLIFSDVWENVFQNWDVFSSGTKQFQKIHILPGKKIDIHAKNFMSITQNFEVFVYSAPEHFWDFKRIFSYITTVAYISPQDATTLTKILLTTIHTRSASIHHTFLYSFESHILELFRGSGESTGYFLPLFPFCPISGDFSSITNTSKKHILLVPYSSYPHFLNKYYQFSQNISPVFYDVHEAPQYMIHVLSKKISYSTLTHLLEILSESEEKVLFHVCQSLKMYFGILFSFFRKYIGDIYEEEVQSPQVIFNERLYKLTSHQTLQVIVQKIRIYSDLLTHFSLPDKDNIFMYHARLLVCWWGTFFGNILHHITLSSSGDFILLKLQKTSVLCVYQVHDVSSFFSSLQTSAFYSSLTLTPSVQKYLQIFLFAQKNYSLQTHNIPIQRQEQEKKQELGSSDAETRLRFCFYSHIDPRKKNAKYTFFDQFITKKHFKQKKICILITSFSDLKDVFRKYYDFFHIQDIPFFVQGYSGGKNKIFEQFMREKEAIFVGIWGVGNEIQRLGNLDEIHIPKFPFQISSDPLQQIATTRVHDLFYEYTLPRMLISFETMLQHFTTLSTTTSLKVSSHSSSLFHTCVLSLYDNRIQQYDWGEEVLEICRKYETIVMY